MDGDFHSLSAFFCVKHTHQHSSLAPPGCTSLLWPDHCTDGSAKANGGVACSRTAKKQQSLGLKSRACEPQIPLPYSLVTGPEVKIQASQPWGWGEPQKPGGLILAPLYLLGSQTQVVFYCDFIIKYRKRWSTYFIQYSITNNCKAVILCNHNRTLSAPRNLPPLLLPNVTTLLTFGYLLP